MPPGKKVAGRDFKKGDPRINRKGRPKLTPEQKALRESFGPTMAKMIREINSMTPEQIVVESKRTDIPVLKAGLLKTLAQYTKTGDYQKWLEPVICRVLGRPKETFEHTGDVKITLNAEERRKRIDELMQKRRD